MQTQRPNHAQRSHAHETAWRIPRFFGSPARSGAAAALLAAMVVTGCTSDPEPPATDAAPVDPADAAPGQADASPIDASPVDAAPPVLCDPAAPAYDGPVCGPPERPCLVLADSTLPSPAAFRNDAPAVAVDDACLPQVAFSVAEGGYHGFHARLGTDGQWAVAGTPFPIAMVAAAVTPDGAPVLLAYDGTFAVSLATLDAAGDWVSEAVPGQMLASAAGMQRGSDGVVHAALWDSAGLVHYASRADDPAGTWQLAPLGERTDARTVLALSPGLDQVPHLAWWRSDSTAGDWQLRWSLAAGAPETVATLGSSTLELESQRHALAVGPADAANPGGRPHALFARRRQDDPGVIELVHATRTGADTWTSARVDDSDVPDAASCNHEPIETGETCDVRADAIRPIGVVVGGDGDARLVYVEQHLDYTLVATCRPTPRGEHCEWRPGEDRSTAELYVAWPDPTDETGAIARAAVADVFLASAGTVALDRTGSLHVALYGQEPGADGLLVRYLRLGHGGP